MFTGDKRHFVPSPISGGIREKILDVRIKLNGNVQIDMEMQVIVFAYWAERSLYYLSKMFTEQLKKGQDYNMLQKCIHVGIQALVEVCQEMGISKEDTAAKVVQKFSAVKDKAWDYVEKYWKSI